MKKYEKKIKEIYEALAIAEPTLPPPADINNKFDGDDKDDIRYIMVTAYSRALPEVIELYNANENEESMSDEECFEALKDSHESMVIDELNLMHEEGEITTIQFNKALEYVNNVDKRLFDISFNDLEY